jgi:hypothetical protein
MGGYFVTFNVTVFEVALPFFGVTVTVTLQEPAFNPLRVVPETLQNFAELATTFNLTFDAESTLSFANTAIDFAVADLNFVNLGIVTVGLVTVGVATVGVVTVPETDKVLYALQFPALSLTRISIEDVPNFVTEADETVSPRSFMGTEKFAA